MNWPWKQRGAVRREQREHAKGDLAQANVILEDHERRIRYIETEWEIIRREPHKTYDGPDRRRVERC